MVDWAGPGLERRRLANSVELTAHRTNCGIIGNKTIRIFYKISVAANMMQLLNRGN